MVHKGYREQVNPDYLVNFSPVDIPGLITFWRFQEGGINFPAIQGEPYTLVSQGRKLEVIEDPSAPLGGLSVMVNSGDWLNLPRKECPKLDIHGKEGALTIVAWIKRRRKYNDSCEFIAGQWNETQSGRQYGLFINISVWGQHDQICGHLSNTGGPTPGYKYCIDGAVGRSAVPYDQWSMVAMSYDGFTGYVWLNGQLDFRNGLNPYPFSGGLHDGGVNGSDFTVGAVNRSGEMGNFFHGEIAGLACYERALSPAEIFALAKL
jgi:hypothetical protein